MKRVHRHGRASAPLLAEVVTQGGALSSQALLQQEPSPMPTHNDEHIRQRRRARGICCNPVPAIRSSDPRQ